MADLLRPEELPTGLRYPALLERVIDLGLTELEPWWIIDGEVLRRRFEGIRSRYPTRVLVPFAVRQDRDDVACFDSSGGGVSIIHDHAEPGSEQRDTCADFVAWLRQAVEDLIAFDA